MTQRGLEGHHSLLIYMDIYTLILFVLAAVLLLAFIVSWKLSGRVMHPPRSKVRLPEAEKAAIRHLGNPKQGFGLDFEEVAFQTDDNLTITGWYIPAATSGNQMLIAVPGGRANRKTFLPFLQSWYEAGINALVIDPRASGKSDDDGFGLTLGLRESRDVHAAVKWLQENYPDASIGAIGFSQGASSVLQAAATNTSLKAIGLMSTGYDLEQLFRFGMPWLPGPLRALTVRMLLWRHGQSLWSAIALAYRPIVAAPKLTQPVLFIQGDKDKIVPAESARTLFERIGSNDKTFWLIEGLTHTMPVNQEPTESLRRISEFFNSRL